MRRISGNHRGAFRALSAFTPAPVRPLVTAVLVGWLLASGSAGALEPGKALNQFPHRSWHTEDGLPQNSTQALAQTPDGYLWAGTYEGLARFDGVRFTVFEPGNTPALPDRSVTALAVGQDGTLWINTNQGMARLSAGRFFPVPLPQGVVPREVSMLRPAQGGGVWLATLGSGLVRLSQGSAQVWRTEQGLANNRVLALAEGEHGSLWVACPEGLQRWDGSAFQPGPAFEGTAPLVSTLVVDPRGTLWAGSLDGRVYQLREGVMRLVLDQPMAGSPISALLVDRQGSLWVASRGRGLLRLADGHASEFNATNGLESGSVLSMLEDMEGNLWLGMGTHGLHRLRDAPFTPYGPPEGLGHDMVGSVREAHDGSLWFTSLGGGITRLKEGRMTNWTTRQGLIDDMVFGSAEGRDGTLWFVTRQGLIQWRQGQFSLLPERGQPVRNPMGQAVHVDEHGTLWVGTQEGLARWDGQQFLPVAPKDKVLGAVIRVMEPRAAGGFWVGTHGGGLAWYSEGHSTALSAQGTPIDGDVRGLFEDGDTLWVGTTDGLFRWKNGHFARLGRAQGLFDDVVFQILPDGKGNLWMTCNKGIFRVARQELEAVADGRREKLSSHVYGRQDGMRSEECNALGGPSGIRASDGRLWFPTIHGAVAYDAAQEKPLTAPPPLLIEELWVDGHALPASQWALIPPGSGRVELHYTSAALGEAERLRFRYKLEGVDADWVEAGSRRVAYYTRLPPGAHRFRVEAFIPGVEETRRGADLMFRLRPRFFETVLFRLGVGLALVLAVAGGVRLRLTQSRKRERELQSRVDERTAELAIRLRQLEATQERLAHAEKLVAVGTLASGVGHEINNPLAYILSNLRFLATELRSLTRQEEEAGRWQEVEDALSDTLHGAERVRTIVQQLRTLARSQSNLHSRVEPHAVLDKAVEMMEQQLLRRARLVKDYGQTDLVLGDEARLCQVFIQLLANAIQATPEGHPELHEVRLTTRRAADGRTVIEVRDSGQGIPAEVLPRIFEPFFTTKEAGEGTGLGLSICHSTIRAMEGEIQVESEPGRGSTFRVLLPSAKAPAEAVGG